MYTHVDVEYAPPKRLNQWEGKEKQMPDWGPINDSKSGTYLRTYTSQYVATQWISNSAGNQIEIEKGQIDYWEKGRPRNYRVGLRLDLQVAYLFTIKIYISHTRAIYTRRVKRQYCICWLDEFRQWNFMIQHSSQARFLAKNQLQLNEITKFWVSIK